MKFILRVSMAVGLAGILLWANKPTAQAQDKTPPDVMSLTGGAGGASVKGNLIKVPAGRYTAFIFTTSGLPLAAKATPARPYAAAVVFTYKGDGLFIAAVGPGTTATIPFSDGLDVADGDVTIQYTTMTTDQDPQQTCTPNAIAVQRDGPHLLR